MKTYAHLWQYLAEVFLEWEIFQTIILEKIKTHTLCPNIFSFRKMCHLWEKSKHAPCVQTFFQLEKRVIYEKNKNTHLVSKHFFF